MTGMKHELGACGFQSQDKPLSPGHRDSPGKGDCFEECNNYGIAWLVISINTEFEGQQAYKESLGSWSLLL